MIVCDTETTGLQGLGNTNLKNQPFITEFAGIKLDDETLEEVDRLEFLCKPPIPITPEITKITGITDNGKGERDVKSSPPIAHFFDPLIEFFLGERSMTCHNVGFDRDMFVYEFKRHDMITRFPWPPLHYCTVELTEDIKGFRMNLRDLHEHYLGEKFEGAHAAMVDVEALTRVVREMRKENRI